MGNRPRLNKIWPVTLIRIKFYKKVTELTLRSNQFTFEAVSSLILLYEFLCGERSIRVSVFDKRHWHDYKKVGMYTYFRGVFKSSLPCWDLRSCFPSAEWHFSNCNFCCQSLLIITWKIISLGKLSLKRKHLTDSSNEKYCMLCLLSRALPMSH